ncbi:MAG: SDR family oxidoreductase [Burkholderiales bacterium]|nr:MAG: SDR family oxidoreductase [Burkholderiales bacterium]
MKIEDAKHAFVTGGASGIGLGIANALAERGLNVTIADINEEALEQVVATRANQFRGVRLDTRDRDNWQSAKTEAENAFGPVDILINNAGIAPHGKQFADTDAASFDTLIDINLIGPSNGVLAFADDMRKRGKGHMVNTSSSAGLVAFGNGVGVYSVAKFGVTALSLAARQELAPHGVGVSVLCPGIVATNLHANTVKIGGESNDDPSKKPTPTTTPAEIGEMVVSAIENDEAVIVTDKDMWKVMEYQMAPIKAACEVRDRA